MPLVITEVQSTSACDASSECY